MTKVNILGVSVNRISEDQAVKEVESFITRGGKHYIVTPNPEFIVASKRDDLFRSILNEADLAIPDSSRLSWALNVQNKNIFQKIISLPLCLFPVLYTQNSLGTVTGTDLMDELITLSSDKGFRIGLLGGQNSVALRLSERLLKTHPTLKIVFVNDRVKIDQDGNLINDPVSSTKTISKDIKNQKTSESALNSLKNLKIDILFVAFGAVKQEKWIAKNLKENQVGVMMGVGGAFDYLSGDVARAPRLMRLLGMEWIFRGVTQPWRIRRFLSLFEFIYLVLCTSVKS